MPTFQYTFDGKSQSTTEHQLTLNQILANAEIDPATHYLVQIEGRKTIPIKGKEGVEREIRHEKHYEMREKGLSAEVCSLRLRKECEVNAGDC